MMEVFRCPGCGILYSTYERASDCCEVESGLGCEICGILNTWIYEDEDSLAKHVAKAHPATNENDNSLQYEYDEALRGGYVGGQALYEFERKIAA